MPSFRAPTAAFGALAAALTACAGPRLTAGACALPVHAVRGDRDPAASDPELSSADCARFRDVEALIGALARTAGVELEPTAVSLKDRVTASYSRPRRRVVVTLGALRDPRGPGVLAGHVAHELGHVLQFDEQKRTRVLDHKEWRQIEVEADAIGLLLLEKSGAGQSSLHLSQEASWGCAEIMKDKGDGGRPPYGTRWANAALLRERVAALAKSDGMLMTIMPLDAFYEDGRVRGAFLTGDAALAARLDSDELRSGLVERGCGKPDWSVALESLR